MPRANSFLLMGALNSTGSAIFLIVATYITSTTFPAYGGILTAAFLTLTAVGGIVGTSFAPRLVARHGSVRTLLTVAIVRLVIVGVLVPATLRLELAFAVLLMIGPIEGFNIGVRAVVYPVIGTQVMKGAASTTWSRWQVAKAPAYAIGALIGGLLVDFDYLAADFALVVLLTVPTLLWTLRWRNLVLPDAPTPTAAASTRPLTLLRSFRTTPYARRLFLLVAVASVGVLPIVSMVVPLLNQLGKPRLIQGAGLLLATISLGGMGTTVLYKRLKRRASTDLTLIGLALGLAGVLLIFVTLFAWAFDAPGEVISWGVIGFVLGSAIGVIHSGETGAAVDSLFAGTRSSSVAALTLAGRIFAPVGLILWGAVMDVTGAGRLLLGVGVVVPLVAALSLLRPPAVQ